MNLMMKATKKYGIVPGLLLVLLGSCSVIEKASMHGLNSGFYTLEVKNKNKIRVYADVTDEKIDVYQQVNKQPGKDAFLTIPLVLSDTMLFAPVVFKKAGLDIDITSVLLKYRPSVYALQPQLTSDFNLALYAGWRYDKHLVVAKKNPLGRQLTKIKSHGYDVGVFAGPGLSLVSPFTTQNLRTDEYSGMIIQTGIAAFIETNVASFGIALGYDQLMNADRKLWIYRNKPWVGFMVGIALPGHD
jgi:hypothetical protein